MIPHVFISFPFFGLLAELLIKLITQLIFEYVFAGLTETFQKKHSLAYHIISYSVWGIIAGDITLHIFPQSFIPSTSYRVANLIISPFILAGCMVLVGKLRDKLGQVIVERMDSFGYAFLFALMMTLMRSIFAH